MDEIVKSSSIIKQILLNKFLLNLIHPNVLLVHTSIINKVENALHKRFANTDWEMCEQILQIGSERFEMHLIIVLHANNYQANFLVALFNYSQFSFTWEKNLTLFIAAEEFHIMKEFIKRYNLEAYILKIEEKLEHSVNGDHPIKVVSFNQSRSEKFKIIKEFKKCLNVKIQSYLFVTNGLPWQESNLLQRIRLNDNICSLLPIILRHLGTLNYANELNIMDLLSLRLAISDVHDQSKSNLLSYEIDFMIKRILAKLIKNNHLTINKYLIVKNIKPTRLLMFYLVYEFQHLFQTLDVDLTYEFISTKSISLHDTITLKEEIDVLNKLKKTSNINYCIDGGGFDQMSLSLFVDLIKFKNVYKIVLDTNYRWHNSVSLSKQYGAVAGYKEDFVNIYLRGENTYNFIEGFTAELKTIRFLSSSIILNINCNLNDYRIFDDLRLHELMFKGIKIDLNMLHNLQQCAAKPSISLIECSLENISRNWQLINNLGKLLRVSIYEDEGTWLSMFEFILKEIHESNTNVFIFNRKGIFTIMEPRPLHGFIELSSIKFPVEEQNSKLEIRCVKTNEVVDLYCRKCKIYQEGKSDYEFFE